MNKSLRKQAVCIKRLTTAVAFCATCMISTPGVSAPVFYSTSNPSHWEVATKVGGVDGSFDSFPTDGFLPAVVVTGRVSEGVNWIANNSTGTNGCCIGTWTFLVFRQTFDLTGYDPATGDLQFQWAADDSGERFADRGSWVPKFRLNGGGLTNGEWATGATYNFGSTTNITSGFINGRNVIDFYVQGNGITDGFALKSIALTAALSQPTSVPEPGTFGLLVIALGILCYLRPRART